MTDTYTPNTTKDASFKNDVFSNYTSHQKVSNDIYKPRTIDDQVFPDITIASDVIGSSLNTHSYGERGRSNHVRYEANYLPQNSKPVWRKNENISWSNTIEEIVSFGVLNEGILHMTTNYDISSTPYGYNYYAITDNRIDDTVGFTFSTYVRVTKEENDPSGWGAFFVAVQTQSTIFTVTLGVDTGLLDFVEEPVYFNIDNYWYNEINVTILNGQVNVYDGSEFKATGKTYYEGQPLGVDNIRFGNISGGETEIYLDHFYYITNGAFQLWN